MRSTDHATARTNDGKAHSSPCAPELPFCGLGDLGCLASRLATCSGLALREEPLAAAEARPRPAANS
jgi:hypothetical protein